MKRILFLVLLIPMFIACSSNGDDMGDINDGGDMGGDFEGAAQGIFVSDAHPTMGTATVNDAITNLALTNFKTDDGPTLLLYLSTELDSQEFVDLGELKGLEGDFDYAIPAGTDIEKYKYVVVWCIDFSVSFGHAELK
ncbi:DM13 domain-containing protein [Lutimonas sp.]|uniref:DM13 domain-containing protein n=1 Tax=Lutimonas sp. TaxID=1872403 RepID=UPI003D9B11FA